MAQSASDLDDWPFCYFKAFGCSPGNTVAAHPNRDVFFGFVFHGRPDKKGPACIAGTVDRKNANVKCDQWILAAAVGVEPEPELIGALVRTDGIVRRTSPTNKGEDYAPGIGDIRWFEVPLGSIDSADRLKAIVLAAIALHADDEAPAQQVVADGAAALAAVNA